MEKKEWNIVGGEMMREIINYFFFSPEFKDKVLEFKRVRLGDYKNNMRFFIGSGIKPANYPQWTKGKDEFMSRFKSISGQTAGISVEDMSKIYDDYINKNTSLVVVEGDRPSIIPIMLGRDNSLISPMMYDLFGPQVFTEEELNTLDERYNNWRRSGLSKAPIIGLWFYMDDSGHAYSSEQIDENGNCKFNIRVISMSEWIDIVTKNV